MRLALAVVVLVLGLVPFAAGGADTKPAPEQKKGADPWFIPEAASARVNPLVASPEAIAAARALWRENCVPCHGNTGKGDGPNARLHERRKGYAPRDVTDPNVQENLSDGDLFWRISKGLIKDQDVIMPTYEAKTSETDRWQLVLFVRELGRAAGAAAKK